MGASCGKPNEHRVLVLGLSNAGKSTLAQKLWPEPQIEVKSIPNRGLLQVETFPYRKMAMTVFDVHSGGRRNNNKNNHFFQSYFANTKGLVFVIDASPASFSKLEQAARELHNLLVNNPELRGVPLLLLANKTDVAGAMSAAKLTHYLDLEFYDQNPWLVQSCSAKTGNMSGVYNGLEWLHQQMEPGSLNLGNSLNATKNPEVVMVELQSFSLDHTPAAATDENDKPAGTGEEQIATSTSRSMVSSA